MRGEGLEPVAKTLPGAEDRAEDAPTTLEDRGCTCCATMFRTFYWSDRHLCDWCLVAGKKEGA